MIDFFHRHRSALRRLSFLLLAAVLGLLLIAQIAAFAAARIFSYAMNRQHMLRGHISVEKISADIAGYALPGRITAVTLTKLNFRVRRPVDAARVRVLAGDEELFAGKVRPFKPSVMESFPLPAKVIQRALDLDVSEIVLSVDPIEEA